MKIELHIEELVLHGFDPSDKYAIGDAVQRELARLLAETPPAPSPRVTGRADGGTFTMERRDAAGVQIAESVQRAIGGK